MNNLPLLIYIFVVQKKSTLKKFSIFSPYTSKPEQGNNLFSLLYDLRPFFTHVQFSWEIFFFVQLLNLQQFPIILRCSKKKASHNANLVHQDFHKTPNNFSFLRNKITISSIKLISDGFKNQASGMIDILFIISKQY